MTITTSYIAQVLAGKYGRLTGLHGRFSGQDTSASGLLGTDEMLGAVLAGGPCYQGDFMGEQVT
jgi:hypothetical protein